MNIKEFFKANAMFRALFEKNKPSRTRKTSNKTRGAFGPGSKGRSRLSDWKMSCTK
jgi:hypothetical protein